MRDRRHATSPVPATYFDAILWPCHTEYRARVLAGPPIVELDSEIMMMDQVADAAMEHVRRAIAKATGDAEWGAEMEGCNREAGASRELSHPADRRGNGHRRRRRRGGATSMSHARGGPLFGGRTQST